MYTKCTYLRLLGGTGGPAPFFRDPGGANIPPSVYDRLMSSLSLRRIVRYLFGEEDRSFSSKSSSRLTEVRIFFDITMSTSLSSSVGGALSVGGESVGGASLVGKRTVECNKIKAVVQAL